MCQALFYVLYNYCHLILLTISEMGTITNPISDKKAESQRIQGHSQGSNPGIFTQQLLSHYSMLLLPTTALI